MDFFKPTSSRNLISPNAEEASRIKEKKDEMDILNRMSVGSFAPLQRQTQRSSDYWLRAKEINDLVQKEEVKEEVKEDNVVKPESAKAVKKVDNAVKTKVSKETKKKVTKAEAANIISTEEIIIVQEIVGKVDIDVSKPLETTGKILKKEIDKAAKLAKKEEEKIAKLAKKKEENDIKKNVVVNISIDTQLPLIDEAYDEEEEVEVYVKRFEYNGEVYFKSTSDVIYDMSSKEEIGSWDVEKGVLLLNNGAAPP